MVDDYPDYEGGKQKVYLVPEWAALEAVDKNLYGYANVGDDLEAELLTYAVPTGKTLYVVQFGAGVGAATGLKFYIRDIKLPTTSIRAVSGGYTGGSAPLNKPVVVEAGHTLSLIVHHFAGGTKEVKGFIMAYEL